MSPSLRVAPQAFCCPQFSRSDVGHAVLCQSHETDMVLIDLCGCSKRQKPTLLWGDYPSMRNDGGCKKAHEARRLRARGTRQCTSMKRKLVSARGDAQASKGWRNTMVSRRSGPVDTMSTGTPHTSAIRSR